MAMPNHQLLPGLNPLVLSTGVVAGTSDTLTFTEVSMSPQYDGLLVVALLGTVTATGLATLQAKGSNTTGVYGAGTIDLFDHVDSGVPVQAFGFTGDSNLPLAIDIYRPLTAFVRAQMVRATANVVVSSVMGYQYSSKVQATVLSGVASHYTGGNGWDIASNPSRSLV